MPIYLLLSLESNQLSSETPHALGNQPTTSKPGWKRPQGSSCTRLNQTEG